MIMSSCQCHGTMKRLIRPNLHLWRSLITTPVAWQPYGYDKPPEIMPPRVYTQPGLTGCFVVVFFFSADSYLGHTCDRGGNLLSTEDSFLIATAFVVINPRNNEHRDAFIFENLCRLFIYLLSSHQMLHVAP